MYQLLMFVPFRAVAMPWTFLTSGFLHGGLLHLALNMYALWIVGQYLERSMGHARFAGVYFASLLAGPTAVFLFFVTASLECIIGIVEARDVCFRLTLD